MVNLSERIKRQATELGFQKVGICPAEAPDHLPALAGWLERGNHGTMEWIERTREKRLDISKMLPGIRSVVVVGMNYYTKTEAKTGNAVGRISRYAHGTDYHDIMQERLEALEQFVRQQRPGRTMRIYSDTGPVSEKVWAEKAGLGWQGKHSNLLTQDYSSWIFLGVLLLDFELEYDRPATDHCGTCTRCIEACPTQAITEPYVVDSRRCISYLNIEHRDPIAAELRPGMGNWIYGCDVCQDVCPWNRFTKLSQEKAFAPAPASRLEDPREWLELSMEEFRRRFRHSPMKRAKWAGMLRNIVIALGNSRDRRYAPALAKALAHSEPLVRGHAAWALGRLCWEGAADALAVRMAVEQDPWVCSEITSALERLNRPPS